MIKRFLVDAVRRFEVKIFILLHIKHCGELILLILFKTSLWNPRKLAICL